LQFSHDGNSLTTQGQDRRIRSWDLALGKELASVNVAPSQAMAVSSDGQVLAVGDALGNIKLLNMVTGKERTGLQRSWNPAAASFAPDGKTFVWGGFDGTVKRWDLESGKEHLPLRGHAAAINLVEFAPDSNSLLTRDENQVLKLWNMKGRERATLT